MGDAHISPTPDGLPRLSIDQNHMRTLALKVHSPGLPEGPDSRGTPLPVCSLRLGAGQASHAGQRARTASFYHTATGTAQRDRRRQLPAQPTRPGPGKTGASIAQAPRRKKSAEFSQTIDWLVFTLPKAEIAGMIMLIGGILARSSRFLPLTPLLHFIGSSLAAHHGQSFFWTCLSPAGCYSHLS